MQEHHINYPVLAGELDVIALSRVYGNDIGALPYTVIIDRQGKIVFVKQGRLSGEVAERVIARLL
jgi:peroxiredoxin